MQQTRVVDRKGAETIGSGANVDITFTDITYTTWNISVAACRREVKEILRGVSGEFRGGELSVIMGPSGAGKSTLLNILAGYASAGARGTVTVAGRARACGVRGGGTAGCAYIQQEDALRPRLSVREAVTAAAHLRLGFTGVKATSQAKRERVEHVLELLGLGEHAETLTGRLSGGQRRRLTIALELVSDPKVLYLDEPTTGLDAASCTRCVQLLKRLASEEGRTVVCTLHQPSALLFEQFDRLYALAEGRCVFQGTPAELLPRLAAHGLRCPPYHNPADFLIEVCSGEIDVDLVQLARAATVHNRRGIKEAEKNEFETMPLQVDTQQPLAFGPVPATQGAGQLMQFAVLLGRNVRVHTRSCGQLALRAGIHAAVALLFGYLYAGVGIGADTVLANYVYLYGSVLLNVYTGKMGILLSLPQEMAVLGREHFNRWYRLTPYVLSTLLVELPLQALCTWLYVAISYRLTGQPLDQPHRYYCFVTFCILGALCAQAWGYFIGATTPVKLAVFVGPVVAVVFSIFGFCIALRDTPTYFRWLYHISYYRAGFHGVVVSVYGLDRQRLPCPEGIIYCHYSAPENFLDEMDITDIDLSLNASLIVTIAVLMHILTFGALWYRLNRR